MDLKHHGVWSVILALGLTMSACSGHDDPVDDDEAGTLRPVSAVSAVSDGATAYDDRPVDESWLAEAQRRIEQIRMAELRVVVTDENGQPLPEAQVHVRMTRHAFLWGSALSDGAFLGVDESRRTHRSRYLNEFARLFNLATIEGRMRWHHWENPKSREQLEAMMRWCEDQDIALHGHTLVYPGWKHLPPELQDLQHDPQALRQRIDAHILDQAGTLAGRVHSWDVLNEPYSIQILQRLVGYDQMAHWFRLARQADPKAVLVVNENNIVSSGIKLEGYVGVIQRLLDNKAPLDAIGVQGHFRGSRFNRLTNPIPTPQVMWERFERLASLGLPVRITEFDIFNDQPDHALLLSEQDQARLTREFLITAFSHPRVDAFVLWGFWDGAHWMNNAPIFRRDWSVKPSGQAYLDLVHNRWRTDAEGTTGSDGAWLVRGFLGDYTVTAVTADGRRGIAQGSLTSNGSQIAVQVAR